MGSFVPAAAARVGPWDRIFTRIGAGDDLAKGQSTFMVEMTETANILRNATRQSLVLLDEVGRGTSTYDGLSIAWAVAELLHDAGDSSGHDPLRDALPPAHPPVGYPEGVANHYIAVKEWKNRIIFLRKIVPGATNRSYGIQVARLAGVPDEVIGRAKEVLENLEKGELDEVGMPTLAPQEGRKAPDSRAAQPLCRRREPRPGRDRRHGHQRPHPHRGHESHRGVARKAEKIGSRLEERGNEEEKTPGHKESPHDSWGLFFCLEPRTSFLYPLFDADPPDLFEVRDALEDLLDPVLQQRRHPVVDGGVAQVLDGRLFRDEALDVIRGDEKLVDALAPPVARLIAVVAAPGLVELEVLRVGDVELGKLLLAVGEGQVVVFILVGRIGLLAVFAERPGEPLGQDTQQRVREIQGVDAPCPADGRSSPGRCWCAGSRTRGAP